MKTIVFAGGCFWGVEEYFNLLKGVTFTKVGYANGNVISPTYEQVCTSATGHYEAVYVEYDDCVISLEKLLDAYWEIVDPTALNRQGPDIGSQYSTGIFYTNEDDRKVIEESKERQQVKYRAPIVTAIEPLKCFFNGEEYHQKYLKKNPKGYCHIPLDKYKN
ncbi:peptide methionine sulfoxide reductase MsrA [Vallitalea longa]|uniref:Peptide methionine sulfoxide reductase MsrA n=1 Tax=Vallitalea longa TaxID=2936439 RepID=A0A9W5Y974_9FIRM|nr:peptide-methionine (S)-S-oxide reductase MsrA [Vallitalea longa]GKX28211.1 peptide methionine sulfoxide reductase MsrA [Vallitalea longa]